MFPSSEGALRASANAHNPDEPRGLERLGESIEFGRYLLRLCELDGWTFHRHPLFAGRMTLYVLERDSHVIVRAAGQLAEVALPLYLEAMRLGRGIQVEDAA